MRHNSTIALAAGVALLAACGRGDDGTVVTKTDEGTLVSPAAAAADDRGTSLVRIVNAVPGTGSLSIQTGDEAPFGGVDYKTVTPYRQVRGNMVRFRVFSGATAANDTTISDDLALASNNEVMADGNRYTIFILPEEGDAAMTPSGERRVTMKIVRDELETDSTKAQVRFVNGAPGAGELNLMLRGNNDPIFDDVNYRSEAGFKSIDPVTNGQLTIRRDDGRATVATVSGIRSLQAGRLYTIVVAGRPGAWEVISFEDTVREMTARDTTRTGAVR